MNQEDINKIYNNIENIKTVEMKDIGGTLKFKYWLNLYLTEDTTISGRGFMITSLYQRPICEKYLWIVKQLIK